ncbi:MAG: peptidyl-prolyl cis-trans isomerase [Desulfobulbaceae bacterium]|nr:peptidyl-prolyl cis-trans isomerase [Desulfobulbaceae bacterium]
MYRTISKIILTIIVAFSFSVPLVSFAQSGKRFLTINGVEYTDEDFKNWWRHWNDKNEIALPALPDDYIDFMLMVQQGMEMGYDAQPNYLHKLDVFLQVRAMMALKYEEVDSKAIVTEADLRKYFDDNYATKWTLQILTFDSESKAKKVYDAMMPFKGDLAGRLVFADWYGGDAEEKAEAYDEVKVSAADFYKNKKASWLPVVRSLTVNDVSNPFFIEDTKKYILIRLMESKPAGEAFFAEKKAVMTELLVKQKRNQLTLQLIENLKKKFNVKVDRELLQSVKMDIDYSKDFLEQKVVSMNDFQATVYDLIYNVKKEKNIRKDISDEVLKDMVLNSLISQTLVNKESLLRGYEKRPPLLWTYNFYKQNRLRAEVEAGLMNTVVPSDQDIQNYYDLNIATFTIPEKLTYVLLNGDEEVLKKVWLGVLQGSDFTELTEKYSLESLTQTREVIELSPVVVAEMKKLDKGGVSLPFPIDGSYAMIKLIDRIPGQVHPLAQVKDKVVEQFKKEKFELIKTVYIDKLKSKSKIDLNGKVWKGILRELSNGKKD